MARTKSPLQYYGGKANLARWIVSHLPYGKYYVEPYCGSAAVFFAKDPHPAETLNDMDGRLVNFYRHLADPKKFPELKAMIEATPYSRAEFNRAKAILDDEGADPLERAWAYFVANMQSMNGGLFAWSFTIGTIRRGMPQRVSAYLSHIEMLHAAHWRLRRVQVECDDALKVIARHDSSRTVFYIDPPYLASTRVATDAYAHEATDDHHEQLIDLLLNLKGKAVLSGYDNDVYRVLEENGWERHERRTKAYAKVFRKGKRANRTEILWVKR